MPLLLILLLICNLASFNAAHPKKTWEEKVFEKLSLREKIGQLFMIDMRPQIENEYEKISQLFHVDMLPTVPRTQEEYLKKVLDDIKNYHVGGVIFMKGTIAEQVSLNRQFQTASSLPLLIAQDAEWGPAMRIQEVIKFPYNMTLGALPESSDPLIFEMGHIIGKQLKALGVHLNFAPVVDINNNPQNPIINHRSFGENKERVAHKGLAFMKGLQSAGILACAKHFPGHGNTAQDSHVELPMLSRPLQKIEELELYPFKHLINNGVDAVMTAHIHLPEIDSTAFLPATMCKQLLSDVLKNKLSFKGLIIADAMMMKAIINHFDVKTATLLALNAGVDLILMSPDIPQAITALEKEAHESPDTLKIINEKALKILSIKSKLGLHKKRMPDNNPTLENLNSTVAANLKKKIFENAITIARDGNFMLPLKKASYQDVMLLTVSENSEKKPLFAHLLEKKLGAHHKGLSWHDKEAAQEIENDIKNADTIIVSLHDMLQHPSKKFGITDSVLELIEKISSLKKKIILTVFGNPYSLKHFESQKTVIVGYEDEDDAHRAAAKIIVGELPAKGSLPVSASTSFHEGRGVHPGTPRS